MRPAAGTEAHIQNERAANAPHLGHYNLAPGQFRAALQVSQLSTKLSMYLAYF